MEAPSVALVVAVIVIAVFVLVAREVMCWYFKLNHLVRHQEEIIRLLKIQNAIAQGLPVPIDVSEELEKKKGLRNI